MFRVYIKTDEKGRITAIGSNAFIDDFEGWKEIDSGEELKHLHAQNNYLPKPVRNEYGVYNYIFKNGKIEEVPEEEIKAEEEQIRTSYKPALAERFEKLETAINKILKFIGKEV